MEVKKVHIATENSKFFLLFSPKHQNCLKPTISAW